MERPPESNDLLDEVLHDEALARLRAKLHLRCLDALAQRRRRRRRIWLAPVAASLLAVVWLGYKALHRPEPAPDPSRPPTYLVATAPDKKVSTVSGPPTTTFEVVRTDRKRRVADIDDQAMLALFPDVPRALVRDEGAGKRLVFLRPGDRRRLFQGVAPSGDDHSRAPGDRL